MVENTGNNGGQTKFQVRGKDFDVWLDVLDSEGNFVEPSWYPGVQYRVKPEVVKPKWPTLDLDHNQLWVASGVTLGESWSSGQTRNAINYGIAHALETGLVVLPKVTSSVQNINYKKDIEDWGSNALNEAAREFISKQDKQRVSEIRAHDCKVSKCGVVCTFGDW